MKELKLKDAFDILPKRKYDSHKGDYGTLLCVTGSALYRGAAVLCALGALRTGVGILRVAAEEAVIDAVCNAAPEATYLPISTEEGFDIKAVLEKFSKTTALLCGCGLTTELSPKQRVHDIIKNCPLPIVLDADGLNNITKEMLSSAKSKEIIITPHIGEFSRLTGISAEEIKRTPSYALEFAKKYGVTVVLKDCDTIIATPMGKSYISRFGNPGLSRGGSGDILAGMTASFLAQGLSPENAAICGVVLHGAAADRCAKRLSIQGMLPHDILYDLCEIFKEEGR